MHSSQHTHTKNKRDYILDKYFFFFHQSICFVSFIYFNTTQHNLNYVHACWIFNIKYWKWKTKQQRKHLLLPLTHSLSLSQTNWFMFFFFSFFVFIHSFKLYRFYSFWIYSYTIIEKKTTAATTTKFSITWVGLRDFLENRKILFPIDFPFILFLVGTSILGQQQMDKGNFF